MLLRALGFLLGIGMTLIVAVVFHTLRTTPNGCRLPEDAAIPPLNERVFAHASPSAVEPWAVGAWSMAAAIALTALLAWGTSQLNKQPVISEPEEYSLVDGVATIPFSQVEDGHLHRFAYTAADGTEMRFIIILKNGGAYGVGLDACETCGDAGYYEQDGKIICKRCDVAINLATIGFKGGCNPIPFPYQVDDGAIIIHAADLDALSAHFQ